MTWLRVDDQALTHFRTLHLRSLRDPIATAEAVIGWVMLAASWSGAQNSDCFVSEGAGVFGSADHWEHLAAYALKVGLIKRSTAADRKPYGGQRGWMIRTGEGEMFHLLSRVELAQRAEKRNITRRIPEKAAVLLRDGDQCRYCAGPVNEYDRKSGMQRHLEHPDPTKPDELVVACSLCNQAKAGRSVDEWVAAGGRPLLPPPAERGVPRVLRETTRAWLAKHVVLDDAGNLPDPQPQPNPDPTTARTGPPAGDASALQLAADGCAADQARPDSARAVDSMTARTGPPAGDAAASHLAADGHAADQARPDSASASHHPHDRPDAGPDPPATNGSIAGRDMPGRVGSGRVGSPDLDPTPRSRRRTRGSRGRGNRPPPTPTAPDLPTRRGP